MNGFGVGLPLETQTEGILHHSRMLELLRPAWWMDWQDLVPEDRRYVPMVRRLQSDRLESQFALGQKDNDRYFFLGNEPDRRDQDDTDPEVFAARTKLWVKNVGRCIAVPGVQVTDDGLEWLTEFRRLFRPLPPQIRWHIHIYAGDGTDWTQKWKRFVRWMVDNRCHRKTVISETASFSTTPGNRYDVMTTAFNTMRRDDWLIGVGWFSAHYSTFKPEYERTDLFNKRGNMTMLGDWFRTFATHSMQKVSPNG